MYHRRFPSYGGGANGLVGLLSALYLLLEGSRRLRSEIGTEFLRYVLSGFCYRLRSNVSRIGTHVGYKPHRFSFSDGNAFVEGLCHRHGALGTEAELAPGLLLQGTGNEGRYRVPGNGFLLHTGYGVACLLKLGGKFVGLYLARNRYLLYLLAPAQSHKPGAEGFITLPFESGDASL
ncbi:MAG: hypothetical protein DDT28_00741 [Dehalococcoidia bacterium]|nr:hypothetical protein [Chloroflexota bacterium]